MTTYRYTTADYLASIQRECGKRATTYPKIIAKKMNQGMPEDEAIELSSQHSRQIFGLRVVELLIGKKLNQALGDKVGPFNELIREYQMRKKVYPRLIYFKRIAPETAEYETAVWRELCIWFAETYLGDAQIALNALESKRKKKQPEP